jgi:hypothetical protein
MPAAELAPSDVGGIECDVGIVKLHSEPAKCAAMVPCRDYFRPERRVSARAAKWSIEVEADRPGNALVQGLREVRGKQFSRQFADCFGPIFQFGEQFRREAAAHLPFTQFRAQGVLAALAGKRRLLVNLPDAVGLQMVKRQLRMNRFARRPEFR